jgi:hypothetical protein
VTDQPAPDDPWWNARREVEALLPALPLSWQVEIVLSLPGAKPLVDVVRGVLEQRAVDPSPLWACVAGPLDAITPSVRAVIEQTGDET